MNDPALLPATELAALIRARKLGCRELLEHCLDRYVRFNAQLNAVIWTDLPAARRRADAADEALTRGEVWGPLHGLPTTIKESFDLTGAPTTWGVPAMDGNIAAGDAVATRRLLDAGAVIWGKTNVPLMLSDWQSFNEIYGTTNNPWNPAMTPGGSSGGSAVSLATGMAAVEIGSDIGASIRNPAHYCGVCGHKPTHNIVPLRGHTIAGTVSIPDISVGGPLARGAEDLALILDVVAGPDEIEAPGLRLALPAPRHARLSDYRIAVMVEDPNSAVDAEYQGQILALADRLAKQGATVSYTARPDFDSIEAFRCYVLLLRSFTAARAAPDYAAHWRAIARTLEPEDWSYRAMVARALDLSYRDWLALNETRHRIRWKWHEFFKEWDVLLCPAAAGPAWPHDQKGDRVDRVIEVNGRPENTCHQLFWAGYSGAFFLPSTVCPLGLHASGLPLGVQIVGPHLGDRGTIDFARLLGREFGGYQAPPGYA